MKIVLNHAVSQPEGRQERRSGCRGTVNNGGGGRGWPIETRSRRLVPRQGVRDACIPPCCCGSQTIDESRPRGGRSSNRCCRIFLCGRRTTGGRSGSSGGPRLTRRSTRRQPRNGVVHLSEEAVVVVSLRSCGGRQWRTSLARQRRRHRAACGCRSRARRQGRRRRPWRTHRVIGACRRRTRPTVGRCAVRYSRWKPRPCLIAREMPRSRCSCCCRSRRRRRRRRSRRGTRSRRGSRSRHVYGMRRTRNGRTEVGGVKPNC